MTKVDKRLAKLLERLDKTRTEEDVKSVWARHLKLDYDTSDDHDLYSPQVLFEFKYNRVLSNASQLAPVIAQLMYYLHRLKYHQSAKGIPLAWCAADRNEATIGEVVDWTDLYSDDGTRFDWSLRPSSPDPRLVAAVRAHVKTGVRVDFLPPLGLTSSAARSSVAPRFALTVPRSPA